MKKESYVGKGLLKSLIGIPVGVMALMLAYIFTCFAGSEQIFMEEVLQLQNVGTLITQMIALGIIYYLGAFIIIFYNLNLKNHSYVLKHPYLSAIIFTLPTIFYVSVAIILFENSNIFSENLGVANISIFMQIFAILILAICVKSAYDEHLIKNINQKLRKRKI